MFSHSFESLFTMVLVFSFIAIVYPIKITAIPPQGSPPMSIMLTSSVFDPETSTIYIIGGYSEERGKDISDIYSFSLVTNQWSILMPESEFIPAGMHNHYSYLGLNKVIYVFFGETGPNIISNVFTFELSTLRWGITEIIGDYISGRTFSSITSFSWNNESFIAVYGGFDRDSYDENLYL
jgi:hypothetical protein